MKNSIFRGDVKSTVNSEEEHHIMRHVLVFVIWPASTQTYCNQNSWPNANKPKALEVIKIKNSTSDHPNFNEEPEANKK